MSDKLLRGGYLYSGIGKVVFAVEDSEGKLVKLDQPTSLLQFGAVPEDKPMSNKIDWDKPIECDVSAVSQLGLSGRHRRVVTGKGSCRVEYWANEDGSVVSPGLSHLFTVRNVKTNRDKAIKICKGICLRAGAVHSATYVDALIEAGLLKVD